MSERSSLDDWLDREAAETKKNETVLPPATSVRPTFAYDDSCYRRPVVVPLSCPKGMTYDPGPGRIEAPPSKPKDPDEGNWYPGD